MMSKKILDPTKTTCTDFRETAGKQCLATSLAAVIHNDIINVNAWGSSFLNDILCAENSLHNFISNSVNKG